MQLFMQLKETEMRGDDAAPVHARALAEMHAQPLSAESAAILTNIFNALRATPHVELRPLFEEIVAQRAGVRTVCVRPMELSRALVRDPAQHQPVTIASNGKVYVLDTDTRSHDPERVSHVLQAAAPLLPAILNAPPPRRASFRFRAQSTAEFDATRDRLIGSSAVMQKLRHDIAVMARTDFGVLIEGETGVGKELVARHMHAHSDRGRGPFVPVNCAALVESLFESELFGIEDGVATGVRGHPGKFELAHGGTLLLDEIAELPPAGQAKLLRIVQNHVIDRVGSHMMRYVNVRLIVATNKSLLALVEEGTFRRDLLFRLKALHMRVPPLREHREDIAEIAEAYLRKCDPIRPLRLSLAAADVLTLHDWPGNVRELERALEYALAHAQAAGALEIRPEHLAPDLGQPYRDMLDTRDSLTRTSREDLSMWGMKKRYARFVYHQCARNKRKTCDMLGVSYHTLMAYLQNDPEPDDPDDDEEDEDKDIEDASEVPEPEAAES